MMCFFFDVLIRERGVGRIVRVLKSQGWRRGAGDFTVFPTAADFPQFEQCLPHLKRRLQGEGARCEYVPCTFSVTALFASLQCFPFMLGSVVLYLVHEHSFVIAMQNMMPPKPPGLQIIATSSLWMGTTATVPLTGLRRSMDRMFPTNWLPYRSAYLNASVSVWLKLVQIS
jgi:hypothetical protein